MQKLQNTQSHPLSAKTSPITSVPFTLTGSSNTLSFANTVVSGSFSPSSDLPISHTTIITRMEPSMLAGHMLAQFGNQLATTLARVLDELEKKNQEAIGPIVSILEPYMETNRDLKVNIHPTSSREVDIEITKGERVRPQIHLDESLM